MDIIKKLYVLIGRIQKRATTGGEQQGVNKESSPSEGTGQWDPGGPWGAGTSAGDPLDTDAGPQVELG